MTAFFEDLLDGFCQDLFLENVCKKYHYKKTQLGELRGVARNMLPLMRREAFWERKPQMGQNGKAAYEYVVMSLGSGLDDLQEQYNQKGQLTESYMLEVLAGELLLQAYDAYDRYIRSHTGWHTVKFHFPGSEESFPMELLPQLLERLTGRVACNHAFCMIPQKSVVFVAELTQGGDACEANICADCKNKERCSQRVTVQPSTLHSTAKSVRKHKFSQE